MANGLKYRTYTAIYKGYDVKTNQFIFMERGEYKKTFLAYELSWGVGKFCSSDDLVKYMNSKIDIGFTIFEYHTSHGYYIMYADREGYVLYDAVSDLPQITYKEANQIPATYNNKPVYRYRKKVVVNEIPTKSK